MNTRPLLTLALLCASSLPAWAYPPAPFHRLYGTVRDQQGHPLGTGVGTVILTGSDGKEIIRGLSDAAAGPGINYSLSVAMDSGTTSQPYSDVAVPRMFPFTVRVEIDRVSYVPLQMAGPTQKIGEPSASTRLDLLLGLDSDLDGLPDLWENGVIESDPTGRLKGLDDVKPGDDLDGDGRTNQEEYIDGTYSLDARDGLFPELIDVKNGLAQLRFLAIAGRTYSLRSSGDGANPVAQVFSLSPTGQKLASFYYTDDVRVVDLYVPIDDAKRMFFKVRVE